MANEKTFKKTRLSQRGKAFLAFFCGILCLVSYAAAYYGALNVSQASIAEYFGVATSQVTLYYTFQCLSAVCCGLLGAWLLKKFNLHGGACIGGIVGFCGSMICAFANGIWMIYLGACCFGFCVNMCGPAMLQTITSTWFYKGRATLLGIGGMTEALGTTSLSLLTAWFISNQGVGGYRYGLIIGGCCMLATGILCYFLIGGTPADFGFSPLGAEGTAAATKEDGEASGIDAKTAKRMPCFWILMSSALVFNIGYACFQPQLSGRIQSLGYTAVQAAVAVSIWSWSKGTSKILYGYVADRWGLQISLMSFSAFATVLVVIYALTTSLPVIYACAIGIGIIGGITGAFTLAVSRMVGPKGFLGLATIPHAFGSLGAATGPIFYRTFFTADTAGYRLGTLVGAVFLVGFLVLIYIALQPKNMFEKDRAI